MNLESALPRGQSPKRMALLTMAFSTLGVVYGDIGTSPLYVMIGIFPDPSLYNTQDTIGAISTIVWAITLIPLLEYVFIVLFAGDENGEGGTFVLYALLSKYAGLSPKEASDEKDLALGNFDTIHPNDEKIKYTPSTSSSKTTSSSVAGALRRLFTFRRKPAEFEERGKWLQRSPTFQWILLVITLFGTSLTMSDGLLTPAVSIISAVNGLTVPSEKAVKAVVPVSCVIVVLLFSAQRYGTNKISAFFAPIIFIWMMLLLVTGIINTTQYPGIFRAFNPAEAVRWFLRTKDFRTLGGVILAITGVEALFADLGHFNRPSMQIGFAFVVYPSIIFAYLGQGARLVLDPLTVGTNPFYQSIPGGPSKPLWWIVWLFGILATVIASQAMISAIFSLVHQAMALHCFPKLRIHHTSSRAYGQIYVPFVNWVVMVIVVLLCIFFGTSVGLNNAYGFAVATVLIVTTILLSFVIHLIWGFPLIVAIAFFLFFGFIDGLFWVATISKVPHGAWFPLLCGIALTIFMSFWKYWTDKRVKVELAGRVRLTVFLLPDQDDEKSTEMHGHSNTSAFILEAPIPGLDGLPSQDFEVTSPKEEFDDIGEETSYDTPATGLRRRRSNTLKLTTRREVVVHRLPGVAFFYNSSGSGVPLTFQRFVSQFPALPQIVVFLRIRVLPVSRVLEDDRIQCDKIATLPGFYQATIRFGYMDPIFLKGKFSETLLRKLKAREKSPDLMAELDRAIATASDPQSSPVAYPSTVTHVLQNLEVCPHDYKGPLRPLRDTMVNFYSFINSNILEHASYELPTDGLVVVGVRAPI